MKTYWKTSQVSEGELNYMDLCGDISNALKRGTAKLSKIAPEQYELKQKMHKKVIEVPL